MDTVLPGSLRENVLRSTVAAIVFAEAAAYYVAVDQKDLDKLVTFDPESMAMLITVIILAWFSWFSLAVIGMNHGLIHGILTGLYTGIMFEPIFMFLSEILKGHGVDLITLTLFPFFSYWSFLVFGYLTIAYWLPAGVLTAVLFKVVSLAESCINA